MGSRVWPSACRRRTCPLSISASTWRQRTATCEKRFALRGVQSKRMASKQLSSFPDKTGCHEYLGGDAFQRLHGRFARASAMPLRVYLRGFLLCDQCRTLSNNTLPRQSQHFRVKLSIFAPVTLITWRVCTLERSFPGSIV